MQTITERTTPGGAIIQSECLEVYAKGNATWSLWRDTVGGANMGVRIQLEVVIGERRLTWVEGAGLTRVDCPLDFLARAEVRDRGWRDRVWRWHEEQLGEKHAPQISGNSGSSR